MKIAHAINVRILKESVARVLTDGEYGRAFFDGSDWTIVYDDRMTLERSRFTVAHELGHIFLGHPLVLAKYIDSSTKSFNKKPPSERQADMFAERLLCPACVIWGLGLSSAREIADCCRVEMSVAERRYERMKVLNKRGKYLTDPLEQELYEKYRKYIEESLAEREALIK